LLDPNCVIPEEDLALLRDIVRQAGAIAKAAYDANDSKQWNKADSSPVTEADIAVNNFLESTLRGARPGYGWLSEETKDDHSRHACPRSFVVDPIDGTRAFIDRTPNFAVCVAIIEKGQSIAGVVFNPLTDELYEASLGGGARLNGEPINVTDPAAIAFTPKSDWDVAAASLIATEAGGLVTDIRGEPPHFDTETTSGLGVICAGPRLHALLLARVKPHLAQFAKGRDFKFLGTRMSDRKSTDGMKSVQLLHLVVGGELVDPNRTEFKDLSAVDFVGAYANFEEAQKAWKSAAQRTGRH